MVRYIAEDGDDLLTVQETPPKAYLVLLVNGRASQSFPLRSEIAMGRDKSNSVVIADQKVSRHHASLSPADETFMLIDQGSANGTYLNGVLITQPSHLKDKDHIGIGDTTFLFTTSKPDFEAVISPPAAPAPRAALASSSGINVEQNHKALWILVICLGLIIILLLLMLTTVLGILIGQSQVVGLLLLLASV